MKMTDEAVKRLEDTVDGFSKKYGVEVIADHMVHSRTTYLTFVHPAVDHYVKKHPFHWDDVSSITAGLTIIFADVLKWIENRSDPFAYRDDPLAYIRADILNTEAVARQMPALPSIKKVHFSGPVTCVIWADGTKTLVRCSENDIMDHEKGLAMAIAKKALGTNASGSNYYDIFKEWLPEWRPTLSEMFIMEAIQEKLARLTKDI